MKFTKLTVLALVLALLVCVFVACGGGAETEAETDAETNAPGTETETETEGETEHVHDIEVSIEEATCQSRGYEREICKTCGENVSVKPIPMIDHVAKDGANCTTDAVCKYCETVISAAPGHTFGEATVTKEATCEAEGEKTQTCTVCNEKVTEAIAKLAHVIATVTETKPATLKEAGYVKGTCSLCNKEASNPVVGLCIDFEGLADVTNETLNAEGSAFAAAGVKIDNTFAGSCELVTDENGNTYMVKNSGNPAAGFYIHNTEDKAFNDAIIELSFDRMLIEGTANCSIIGIKVGGELGSTGGTEYRTLCNWGDVIRVGADNGPDLTAKGEAVGVWYNIKLQLDTATYEFKVWLNGELAAETDFANGLIKYKSADGAWTETSISGIGKLPTAADKDADFTSLYLFHYNGALKWAIDNISLAVVDSFS